MTIEELKEEVYEQNLELVNRNLVIYTWGNVSTIDREREIIIIKPRGIECKLLKPVDMSVVDLNGNMVEEGLLPSVDLDIHLELYKAFEEIGGIAHTHSTYATAYAQSLKSICPMGTTHADHFKGAIPCVPYLSEKKIEGDYEKNLGLQIVSYFQSNKIDPIEMEGVLAGGHGPFTWGRDAKESVMHSVILEEVAKIAMVTELIAQKEILLPSYIQKKHYERKYGPSAYFYQEKKDGENY